MITIIISDDHNIRSILLSEDHFFVEHEIHSPQYCTTFTEKIQSYSYIHADINVTARFCSITCLV